MKYGEQLEESVPQWSLHNLDYNSLKHEIKAHTTRDQATAIAIPGHQDTALRKFEDGLYLELCRQHDRVGLFCLSKADEISRRLEHLSKSIQKWIGKCPEDPSTSTLLKRQRRFAKYERELLRCGDDIHALNRFADAQIIAFRKIIKKYKKWTASTTLGSRFHVNVLSDPKSFTKRDYSYLQSRYEEVLGTLREAVPLDITSPSSDEHTSPFDSRPSTSNQGAEQQQPYAQSRRSPAQPDTQVKYWNEYDDGSEAGGPEDDYAIYIDPDNESIFPGLGYIQAIISMPLEKAKQWFYLGSHNPERDPLIPDARFRRGGYASTAINSDTEEEGYASSSDLPARGYSAHYAFPSIGDQKMLRYREHVLFWATLGSFLVSFLILAISGVLIVTGRHKLRVEVDAAVTVGVLMSLLCSCMGLALTLYRRAPLTLLYRLVVWATFVASCMLNGMLLILVVGNAP